MTLPIFIAIAGGSGAGKSSLANTFADTYPDLVQVVHLDDYRKEKELLPRVGKFVNWDHPDTIYWDELARDIFVLKRGGAVTIYKKNERFDFHGLEREVVSRTIQPSQIMLLDGYLSLWHEQIRLLCDFSVFLDASHDQRIARRKKFNDVEDGQAYFDTVLIPMHEQFVEPTKQYADVIINVENISKVEKFQRFVDFVQKKCGLISF